MAIAASLITVTYTFFWFAYKSALPGMDELDLHKAVRVKLEVIERDFRNVKEIVEIGPGKVDLKIFRDPEEESAHINLSGEEFVKRVTYELKPGAGGDRDRIVRTIDRDESVFMAHDKIDPAIFSAFSYDTGGRFLKFDPVINDSYQRERISLVRVRFKLQDRGTVLELAGSVVPRFLFGKKLQPDWNFNSNALK